MKNVYFFFALLIITVNCYSQWNKDSLVRNPVCTATGPQYAARSCTDGAGGAYCTWVDERVITSPSIYVQSINVKGKTQWAANGITVFAGSQGTSAVNTAITTDGSGGAIIIYEISVIGGANQLWAQHVNAAGTLLWGGGVRITDAPDARLRWIENPSQDGISPDGSGGVFVTWQAYQMPYFNYVQHIDANGNLVWGASGVPLLPVATVNGYLTVITSTGNGTAVAGFTDYVNGVYYYYLQKINANGSYAWTNTGVQVSTIIDYNANPGFKVIYDAATTSVMTAFLTGSGFITNLNVQKLDLNGNILWKAGGINTTNLTSTDVEVPDLLPDGKGGMFLSYTVNAKVTVQHINSKGKNTWGAAGIKVDNTTFGNQYNPSLVTDGQGGFIITYNTARSFSGGGAYPIYAQDYTATGVAKWQNGGVAVMVNHTNINHEVPYSIASSKGFAITCWQDDRNTGTTGDDIYAARFGGPTGLSLQTVQTETQATANSISKTASINTYPNPATNTITVSFVLDNAVANASLRIYDATGNTVKHIELGSLQAGSQSVHINTSGLPNGVYHVVVVYATARLQGKIIIAR